MKIEVQNLKCGGCASTIKKGVEKVVNTEVTVDVENSTITFDDVSEEQELEVVKALDKMGYPVVGEHNSMGSKAKSYVSCMVGKVGSS